MAGRSFSLCTPVSSTNKTECHGITEIYLKVASSTINLTLFRSNIKVIAIKNTFMFYLDLMM